MFTSEKGEKFRDWKDKNTNAGNVLCGPGRGSLIIHCACSLALINFVFTMVTTSTYQCSNNDCFSVPCFYYMRGLFSWVNLASARSFFIPEIFSSGTQARKIVTVGDMLSTLAGFRNSKMTKQSEQLAAQFSGPSYCIACPKPSLIFVLFDLVISHASSDTQTSPTHTLCNTFCACHLQREQTLSHFNLHHFLQMSMYFTDTIKVLNQSLLNSKGMLTCPRTFLRSERLSRITLKINTSHSEKAWQCHMMRKSQQNTDYERYPCLTIKMIGEPQIHNFKELNSASNLMRLGICSRNQLISVLQRSKTILCFNT